MTETNCPKCGEELLMYDGYGVCNNCGEICGFNIEEKIEDVVEEIPEEVIEETPANEEIEKYISWEEIVMATSGEVEIEAEPKVEPEIEVEPEVEEEPEAAVEPEAEPEVEVVEESEPEATDDVKEPAEEEKTEEIPPVVGRNVQKDKKEKKKKAGITSIIILLLVVCALWAFIGYLWFAPEKDAEPKEDTKQEEVIEEIPAEEEPVVEETEETDVSDSETTTVPEKTPEPAPQVKEEPKKETPAQKPGGIAYKIRKSAGDASTQKGAFADLAKAKAFADSYASEGYKVFDLEGNLVYDPA